MKYCAVDSISNSCSAAQTLHRIIFVVTKVIKSDSTEDYHFLKRDRVVYLGLNILRVFNLLSHSYMLIKDGYDCCTESETRFS